MRDSGIIAYTQELVAAHHGVTVADLKSGSRSRPLVYARQEAMFLVRAVAGVSMPVIGQKFGGRDHTTVRHALEAMTGRIARDFLYAQHITGMTAAVAGRWRDMGRKPVATSAVPYRRSAMLTQQGA